MKKLFLLFALLASTLIFAQAPIASKDLGVDSITGLHQKIAIWNLNIDSRKSIVTINYTIQTIAPNGKVVMDGSENNYYRYNQQAGTRQNGDTIYANLKFDQLRSSSVGQMLQGMIVNDLNIIHSVFDLSKLQQ